MFWTIIGAILFLNIGVPVIFYCAALLLGGIGESFSNIVKLPKKIYSSYRKDGLKGVFSKFIWIAIIFDFYCFVLGVMCMGIAMFAKTKVAPLTYIASYKVEPLASLITFLFGCVLIFLSILFARKISLIRQDKSENRDSCS